MEKKLWRYESPQIKKIADFSSHASVLCSSLQGESLEDYSTSGIINESEIDW